MEKHKAIKSAAYATHRHWAKKQKYTMHVNMIEYTMKYSQTSSAIKVSGFSGK